MGWGGLINEGYCQGGLAFMLHAERHQPSKYSALYNNRLCAVSLRKQMCSLLYKITEHPSRAGIKYRGTPVYVISNTRNPNIILKGLEQQQHPKGVDVCISFRFEAAFPSGPKHPREGQGIFGFPSGIPSTLLLALEGEQRFPC